MKAIRLIAVVLVSIFAFAYTLADDDTMDVELNDGTTTKFKVSDIKKITFNQSETGSGSSEISKLLSGAWREDGYTVDAMVYNFTGDTYTAYEHTNINNGTYEDIWWGPWRYYEDTKLLYMYWHDFDYVEEIWYVVDISANSMSVIYAGDDDNKDNPEVNPSERSTKYIKIPASQIPTIQIED